MRVGFCLFAFVTCGCVSTQVAKLPAYSLAMKLGGPDMPRLLFVESIGTGTLPAVCPYAMVSGLGDSSRDAIARKIWTKAVELKADLVIVQDSGSVYSGSVQAYWGFGIATSQPVYSRTQTGVCYRVCPAKLGFIADDDGMVLTISPDSDLKRAGLLEGDTLLSINGVPVRSGGKSSPAAIAGEFLKARPGNVATLVWVRPGTGRMEGKAFFIENKNTIPELTDSIEVEVPDSYHATDERTLDKGTTDHDSPDSTSGEEHFQNLPDDPTYQVLH